MTDLSYDEQLLIDAAYSGLADSQIVQMSDAERHAATALLDHPTWDFKRLALRLHADGCLFPKQQAALMLRNTPGVAANLLGEPTS